MMGEPGFPVTEVDLNHGTDIGIAERSRVAIFNVPRLNDADQDVRVTNSWSENTD